jgi:hypothetical protein
MEPAMALSITRVLPLVFLLLIAFHPGAARADGGWYVGGSTGLAAVEFDVADGEDGVVGFDDDETAWKLYGGYIVDLPLVDLGVEGGYVDFGSPSDGFSGVSASADASGINLWGVAGVDIGPVGVFGKLGAIAWDLDGRTTGLVDQRFSKSGTDIGYGVGAKFMLFSLEVRAEYERYDIEDGIDMVSVGVNWVF